MIEHIRGNIDELTPTSAVIEAGGVGYLLNISLNTYTALQGKDTAKLFVYEVIREDSHTLFGFISKLERSLFELLISVSGVGGNTARMILSAFSPEELSQIIATEDSRTLKSVKGIGLKTSQRIIVDLKDKIGNIDAISTPVAVNAGTPDNSKLAEEAISALTMLGFAPAATQKIVYQLLKESEVTPPTIENLIKQALKAL